MLLTWNRQEVTPAKLEGAPGAKLAAALQQQEVHRATKIGARKMAVFRFVSFLGGGACNDEMDANI